MYAVRTKPGAGRSRLIENYRGERFKIKTADNNYIDTMFIDKRNASPNGNTLVICFEGNAGFYEIGIAITPIEAGYSVVGWNHPGFGGSTVLDATFDDILPLAVNHMPSWVGTHSEDSH
ncbi:hypothetical protein NQ317_013383 [Molorchus minor]|uniref:Uncharacterized protein n=1 Tax=Molorchus minor TaxID=1323400 RepID=A0ABQ9ITD8_9CUCU|nr:hypothetical protein NQ317_013383 [Molorchus minor]